MDDTILLLIVVGILVIVLIFLLPEITIEIGPRGYTNNESSWDPPEVINDIITPDECKHIIAQATPRFTRSSTVGSQNDPSRTSDTAWVSKNDPVARKIVQKACELSGKPIENCEDLQVVRYKPGTFYRAHHDSCCDDSQGCREFETQGGQRIGTLLVYLNSEFTDGETHFPDFNDLKLKANPGSAIFFRPMGRDECKCHPKAKHAGLPPSSGVKYVCNVWVRENKFPG